MKVIINSSLLLLIAAVLAAVLAGCTSGTRGSVSPSPAMTPTIAPTSASTSASVPATPSYISTFSSDDCLLNIPGKLGDITRVFRAEADNVPRRRVEKVLQRFHETEPPATLLACDLVTTGSGDRLFTIWWIQSVEDQDTASQLFSGFVITTSEAVAANIQDSKACFNVEEEPQDEPTKYLLKFSDRESCNLNIYDGTSGLILYKNNVIGIESPFYSQLFDVVSAHARKVIDKKSQP